MTALDTCPYCTDEPCRTYKRGATRLRVMCDEHDNRPLQWDVEAEDGVFACVCGKQHRMDDCREWINQCKQCGGYSLHKDADGTQNPLADPTDPHSELL